MADYDVAAAKAYILEKFNEQGDFGFLPEGTLPNMLDELQALDEAYMQQAGVDDDGVYDDDDAYECMHAGMVEKYPDYKMYMMRLVEDYQEYNEDYLDSIGAIEWD